MKPSNCNIYPGSIYGLNQYQALSEEENRIFNGAAKMVTPGGHEKTVYKRMQFASGTAYQRKNF